MLIFPLRHRLAAALLLLAAASPAAAQGVVTEGFDFDLLRPAGGTSGLVVVERPRIASPWTVGIGLTTGVQSRPVVGRLSVVDMEPQALVRSRATSYLVASVALPAIELAAQLPVNLYNSTDLVAAGGSGMASAGIGDLRLQLKLPLLPASSPLGMGVLVGGGFPTGDNLSFMGGPGWNAEGDLLFDYRAGKLVAALMGGFRYRTDVAEFINVHVGSTAVVGAGVDYSLSPRLGLIGDVHGGINVEGGSSPFEAVGAVRYALTPSWNLLGGGGRGVTAGLGTPAWRLFAQLSYEYRQQRRTPGRTLIVDNDDVVKGEDKDADGDGVELPADKCPEEMEDGDGFEDSDGCPDEDNDGDGIADARDKCKDQPETENGIKDQDGCPDADGDGDRIADDDDACPDKAETQNGVDDEDGCPDRARPPVIATKVGFGKNKTNVAGAYKDELADIARQLKADPALRLRVEGHADETGDEGHNQELSEQRADSVRRYLMRKHRIAGERIETVGFGSSKPLVSGSDEDSLAKNRRVEFILLDAGNP